MSFHAAYRLTNSGKFEGLLKEVRLCPPAEYYGIGKNCPCWIAQQSLRAISEHGPWTNSNDGTPPVDVKREKAVLFPASSTVFSRNCLDSAAA